MTPLHWLFLFLSLAILAAGLVQRGIAYHWWFVYTVANTVERGITATVLLDGQPVRMATRVNLWTGQVVAFADPVRADEAGDAVMITRYGHAVVEIHPVHWSLSEPDSPTTREWRYD